MATEARSHGQAAATGGGTTSRNGRQIAEPVRSTTAKRRNGSPPCLTRAFQAACRTAAPSTTTNTRGDKRRPADRQRSRLSWLGAEDGHALEGNARSAEGRDLRRAHVGC